MIFKADGHEEYSVPDDPITAELLEDGSFHKRAISICNRNRTQLNLKNWPEYSETAGYRCLVLQSSVMLIMSSGQNL